MHPPKISVIVPLYKTERYVEKCLISIINQTLRDIEIICVDDCSPDNSAAIVEELAKSDSRIRLLRHVENLGLGGARNTGIWHSGAEYIASVDSDDYIEPDMLEALYEGAENGRYDVVVCGYDRVDESGKVITKHLRSKKTIDLVEDDRDPYTISNPAFWNKLWRRSLYIDNSIYFPNHIYYQDAATTPRIYAYAKNIKFIGGGYYKYLVRSESVTNKVSDKHLLDKFREIDFVKNFFLKRGLYEKYQDSIHRRVFDTYRQHWLSIEENNDTFDEKTLSYLRHLLIMREGYFQLDDAVRTLSIPQLKRAFESEGFDILRAACDNALPSRSGTPVKVRRPWSRNPQVLVLTLHSGENEFEDSKRSLKLQTYKNVNQTVFSGLGNVESHNALYSEIMNRSGEYNIFLKLDADMVFADETILQKIVNEFAKDPELDHYIVACDDWMTGKQILGVHAFSNRVRWHSNEDGLFVDPSPRRPGKRLIVERPPHSFFHHSSDPSPFQAFHFGAHRALKITQPGRALMEKRSEAMSTQWDVLFNVWCQFRDGRDRRHGLALLAADLVIKEELGEDVHDYQSVELTRAFERDGHLEADALLERLLPCWGTKASRQTYFDKAIGPAGFLRIQEDRIAKRRALARKIMATHPANEKIREEIAYKVFSGIVTPFLDTKHRKKLKENPTKFFLDAKHPVVKLGKWVHRRHLP